MSIDLILKPVKWLDEQVLTQHTRVAKLIEEKSGINKNTLSDMLTGVSVSVGAGQAILHILNLYPQMEVLDPVYNTIKNSTNILRTAGVSTILNIFLYRKNLEDTMTSESIAVNPVIHYAMKAARALRLPGFVAGSFCLSYPIYQTINSTGNVSDNLDLFVLGSFFTLGVSALYMKDADPKLLDKDPFWKRAYSWAKEKASSLRPRPLPEPAPQPAPIQTYSTIDHYV